MGKKKSGKKNQGGKSRGRSQKKKNNAMANGADTPLSPASVIPTQDELNTNQKPMPPTPLTKDVAPPKKKKEEIQSVKNKDEGQQASSTQPSEPEIVVEVAAPKPVPPVEAEPKAVQEPQTGATTTETLKSELPAQAEPTAPAKTAAADEPQEELQQPATKQEEPPKGLIVMAGGDLNAPMAGEANESQEMCDCSKCIIL
ncbi:expressed unknown protein [Seminavis robusta]|uniref:Uncharacterized protein n=1 Tax=Seminavis robusta TaxID=568900 RepID=A0A9N8HEL4_9STRA|nr:expressed unknown protein [Seminavis robusta]|eukprot:Sro521_g159400.1 n/a (200) ;mRNA; f:40307-40906